MPVPDFEANEVGPTCTLVQAHLSPLPGSLFHAAPARLTLLFAKLGKRTPALSWHAVVPEAPAVDVAPNDGSRGCGW